MRFLAALCLALCSGLGAFAQCHAPRYQAGATFVDSTSVLVRSISIPLQDFSPSKLVCLATRLRERYRERSNILVNIFSSRKAAWTGITVQEYDEKLWRTFAQMHARYSLDADKHEEYIEILPLGVVPSWPQRARPYSTRIDFPVATAPRCRLEINSRCPGGAGGSRLSTQGTGEESLRHGNLSRDDYMRGRAYPCPCSEGRNPSNG